MCYHAASPSKEGLKQTFPEKKILYDQDVYYHVIGFTRPYLPVTLNTVD